MTEGPVTASSREADVVQKLGRLWLVDLPKRLYRFFPSMSLAFLDGSWTGAWPRVAAFAPVGALLVGLLAPLAWPGLEVVYTESLSLMTLVIAGAILSGPVGVMLWLGYAFGDLMFGDLPSYAFDVFPLLRLASRLVPLILLAMLAIVIPAVAQKVVWRLRFSRIPNRKARIWARGILLAGSCGLLVFTWAQAMVVLVNPVFRWVGDEPTVEAIFPVQVRWPFLVGVAFAAALGRVWAEDIALGSHHRAQAVAEAVRQLRAQGTHRLGIWARFPSWVPVSAVTVLIVLTLSGIYERWIDALAVAVVVALLEAWRRGLFGNQVERWGGIVQRWPLVIRFLALVVVSYLVAYLVAAIFYSTGSFRLVLVGALLALIATYVFLPQPAEKGV